MPASTSTETAQSVRNRQIKTAIWTAGSILAVLAGLLLISTIKNPDGSNWLEASFIGQSLSVLSLTAAAILPSVLGIRKDTSVVRDQVENNHVEDPTRISNVRDDLDHKHEQVLARLDRMEARNDRQWDAVASDVRGMRRDFGRLTDKVDDHSTRIRVVEDKVHDEDH